MNFWVYENWQAGSHKAVVHEASCGFCNYGAGLMMGGYDRRHAQWHGPFSTIGAAQAASAAMSEVVVRSNHRCVPSSQKTA